MLISAAGALEMGQPIGTTGACRNLIVRPVVSMGVRSPTVSLSRGIFLFYNDKTWLFWQRCYSLYTTSLPAHFFARIILLRTTGRYNK